MAETVSVSVSGPAFSFLLYENARSKYDQEGFLLGQFVEVQKRSITDNDVPSVHIERTVIVNSIIPCPKLCYFYNGAGVIDGDKINSFLGVQTQKVVGWYKFKHGLDLNWKLSLREKIVHKQLANSFDTPADLFLMCLLMVSTNKLNSVHFHKQTFVRYNDPIYEPIPMHVVNLSDPNTCYKSSIPPSETFKKIYDSLKIDAKKMQGLDVITKIQLGLQNHIDKVVEDLAITERKMHDLSQEVAELEERKKYKNRKERADSPFFDHNLENGFLDENESCTSSQESFTEKRNTRSRDRAKNSAERGNENNLENSLQRRMQNENTRDQQDNSRAQHDNTRTQRDNTKTQQENLKTQNENTRTSNENIQGSNDNVRGSNENIRGQNVNIRGQNENIRGQNENIRDQHEITRGQNDNTQGQNENSRNANENTRTRSSKKMSYAQMTQSAKN